MTIGDENVVAWLCENDNPELAMVVKSESARDAYAILGRTITPLIPQSAYAELAAERDALRADAERYRWLRDTAGDVVQAHILSQRREADEWDDEIDAAMKGANT